MLWVVSIGIFILLIGAYALGRKGFTPPVDVRSVIDAVDKDLESESRQDLIDSLRRPGGVRERGTGADSSE